MRLFCENIIDSQRIKYISTSAIIACLLLLFESCSLIVKPEYIAADKQLAEQEIQKFHRLFNAGDFETIWNQSAPGLQKIVSENDFLAFLNNGHTECGDFKLVIDKRMNLNVGAPIQIRAAYKSQWECNLNCVRGDFFNLFLQRI